MENTPRLMFFSISFFAIIMGLSGLAIALQRAEKVLGLPAGAGELLSWVALATFALLLTIYLVKLLRYRHEVLSELRHPVKLSFFPTISISMLLMSIAFISVQPQLSFTLFIAGAPLHLIFTLFVLSRWIGQTSFEVHHSNPSWFIPRSG